MKTTAQLGMLPIVVEAADYKEIVRQAWRIYRLNEAAAQEGLEPNECMPYCETGGDGNEYAGFVHVPTGRRIRFGQQKQQTGGDWFVRGKNSDSYKGLESWNTDTSHQLPEATVSGQASQRPTVHTPAVQGPASTTHSGDGAPATWSDKMNALEGYLASAKTAGILEEALTRARDKSAGYPEQHKRRAWQIIDKHAQMLEPSGAQHDDGFPF